MVGEWTDGVNKVKGMIVGWISRSRFESQRFCNKFFVVKVLRRQEGECHVIATSKKLI